MKKAYEKPMVVFESFASSVNIAGNCAFPTDTFAAGGCGLPWTNGGTLFVRGNGVCEGTGALDPIPEYSTEGAGDAAQNIGGDLICYNVPYGRSMFNS